MMKHRRLTNRAARKRIAAFENSGVQKSTGTLEKRYCCGGLYYINARHYLLKYEFTLKISPLPVHLFLSLILWFDLASSSYYKFSFG